MSLLESECLPKCNVKNLISKFETKSKDEKKSAATRSYNHRSVSTIRNKDKFDEINSQNNENNNVHKYRNYIDLNVVLHQEGLELKRIKHDKSTGCKRNEAQIEVHLNTNIELQNGYFKEDIFTKKAVVVKELEVPKISLNSKVPETQQQLLYDNEGKSPNSKKGATSKNIFNNINEARKKFLHIEEDCAERDPMKRNINIKVHRQEELEVGITNNKENQSQKEVEPYTLINNQPPLISEISNRPNSYIYDSNGVFKNNEEQKEVDVVADKSINHSTSKISEEQREVEDEPIDNINNQITDRNSEEQNKYEEMQPMDYDELMLITGRKRTVGTSQRIRDRTLGYSPINKKKLQDVSVEKKRQEVKNIYKINKKVFIIQELIETETTYIDNLEYLIEHYLKFMNHHLKKEETISFILRKSQTIHQECQIFLKDLQNMEVDDQGYDEVGAVFLKHKSLFKKYPTYYKYQKYVEELLKNKPERDLVKNHQEVLGDSLGLFSYINTPVQRLARCKLLLEKLLKSMKNDGVPFTKVKRALILLKEKLRRGDDLILLDSIKGDRPTINDTGSFLNKQKFKKQKPPEKIDVVLFAFQKIIIIASPKKNSDNYDFLHSINVADLSLGFLETNLSLSFQDTGKQLNNRNNERQDNIYKLKCINEEIQKEWYTLLKDITEKTKENKKDVSTKTSNTARFVRNNSLGTSVRSLRNSLKKKSTKVRKTSTIKNIPKEDISEEDNSAVSKVVNARRTRKNSRK